MGVLLIEVYGNCHCFQERVESFVRKLPNTLWRIIQHRVKRIILVVADLLSDTAMKIINLKLFRSLLTGSERYLLEERSKA